MVRLAVLSALVWLMAIEPLAAQDDMNPPPPVNESKQQLEALAERWLAAEGVGCTFDLVFSCPGESIDGSMMKGTLHAAPKRFALAMRGTFAGQEGAMRRLIDGSKQLETHWRDGREHAKPETEVDAEKAAQQRRIAYYGGIFVVMRWELPPGEYEINDVVRGTDESRDGQTLQHYSYKLVLKQFADNPAEVELWVDAATALPVKRVFRVADRPGKPVVTLTEHYAGRTGADCAPPEAFQLPAELTQPKAE